MSVPSSSGCPDLGRIATPSPRRKLTIPSLALLLLALAAPACSSSAASEGVEGAGSNLGSGQEATARSELTAILAGNGTTDGALLGWTSAGGIVDARPDDEYAFRVTVARVDGGKDERTVGALLYSSAIALYYVDVTSGAVVEAIPDFANVDENDGFLRDARGRAAQGMGAAPSGTARGLASVRPLGLGNLAVDGAVRLGSKLVSLFESRPIAATVPMVAKAADAPGAVDEAVGVFVRGAADAPTGKVTLRTARDPGIVPASRLTAEARFNDTIAGDLASRGVSATAFATGDEAAGALRAAHPDVYFIDFDVEYWVGAGTVEAKKSLLDQAVAYARSIGKTPLLLLSKHPPPTSGVDVESSVADFLGHYPDVTIAVVTSYLDRLAFGDPSLFGRLHVTDYVAVSWNPLDVFRSLADAVVEGNTNPSEAFHATQLFFSEAQRAELAKNVDLARSFVQDFALGERLKLLGPEDLAALSQARERVRLGEHSLAIAVPPP